MSEPGFTPGEVLAALVTPSASTPAAFAVSVDAAGNEWHTPDKAWTPNIDGAWWTATSPESSE